MSAPPSSVLCPPPSALRPVLPFIPTEDPILPLPSLEEMRAAIAQNEGVFVEWLTQREAEIKRRADDPYRFGWEPAIWHVVDDLLVRGKKIVLVDPRDDVPREIIGGSEVYISGGQRSSKTEYAAARVVRCLVERGWRRAWAFRETGPNSVAMQQPRIYKMLPVEWKNIRKSRIANLRYTIKGGFTGDPPSFVGPNGSQCWFRNYAQDLNTAQGEELDIAWLDEAKDAMPWIEEVRYRLATRNGVLIITFTPIDGYSPTVRTLIDGATTVQRLEATLLAGEGGRRTEDGGQRTEAGAPSSDFRPPSSSEWVPRVQQAAYNELKIVYFNVFDNPFGNAPEIINKARAKGREGILTRCYGVPTKPMGVKFPTFNLDVHVITAEQFRTLAPEGTNKHVCDPCSGRNFAHLWARALPDERTLVVYRESPSPGQYIQGIGDPGWWAESGDKADGAKGDAQKPWGWGHERNIEEVLRLEGWRDTEIAAALAAADCDTPPKRKEDEPPVEEIMCRDMDSRFGSAPTITRSETKTLIESMAELGMTFEPAPGEHQQEGIDELHTLLYYDARRPLGPDNKPRLVIVENCRNTIWSLQNWTGLDGQHGACKDFIDLLRYLALDPPVYVEPGRVRCHGGGAY